LLNQLRKYKGISHLKKAALNVMVRERFIRQNADNTDSNELQRMNSGVDMKIDEEIDNLRR